MIIRRACVATIVIASVLCVDSHAADKHWINPGSGFWSGGGNWSPAGIPNNGDQIFLNTSFGQTVTYDIVSDFDYFGDMLVRGMELRINHGFLANSITTGDFATESKVTLAPNTRLQLGAFGIGTNSLIDLSTGTTNISTVNQVGGEFKGNHLGTRIDTSYYLGGGVLSGGIINNGVFQNDNGTIVGRGLSGPDFFNNGTFIANRVADNSTPYVQNNGRLFINPNAAAQFNLIRNTGSMTFGPGSQTVVNFNIDQQATGQTIQHGSLTSGLLLQGNWTQQAGTTFAAHFNFTIGLGGNGTYELNGGLVSMHLNPPQRTPMIIGAFGSGSFLHSTGTVDFGDSIIVGSEAGLGYYRLSSGKCSAPTLIVAERTAIGGSFIQTGGELATDVGGLGDSMVINQDGASSGLVDLAGGTSQHYDVLNHGTLRVRGNHAGTLYQLNGAGDLSVTDTADLRVERIRQNSITIGAGATVRSRFPGVRFGTHRTRNLSIAQSNNVALGTWDLDKNDLVIDYTGATPAATVRAHLKSGYSGGAWNGTGLRSAAAAVNPANNTALGYAEASEIFGMAGGVFGDVLVDNSAVLVKYTYYGDTDLNGVINFDDYARIDAGFNNNTGNTWFRGDFNYDGVANFDDYALIDFAFNTQGQPLRSIPEPSAALGCIIAAIGAQRRRAR